MSTISKEYAEALFTIALEEDCIDEIYSSLNMMNELFSENPEYIEFLSAPSIPKAERSSKLEECFSGKVPDTLVYYVSVMVKRGDIRAISESVGEYGNLCFAVKSVSSAIAISAVPLSEPERVRLIQKLENLCGHKVQLQYKVDPSLLGGIVVEIDGRIIDGSLRHRMRELKGIISE